MNAKRLAACFFLAIFSLLSAQPVSASANDFHFSSANFDYVLTKDGKLKVKETLVAEFPETDQNHGITRVLPYTSRKGANVILPSTDNITVTRNGEAEPISKIAKERDGYYLYIGKASEYVHGAQTYEITYTYENIVTEFTADHTNVTGAKTAEDYQELYLNVNGDGWGQRFDKITATLHFGDGVKPLTYEAYNKITSTEPTTTDLAAWCYPPTGRECKITDDKGALTFTTQNTPRNNSLTFSVEFAPGTIAVPDQKISYLFLIISLIIIALLILFIILCMKKWQKNAPTRAARKTKKSYYNSRFIAPQYEPLKDLSVAGAKELYLGSKDLRSEFVATLLELAVRGDISIIKNHPEKEAKTGLAKHISFGSSKADDWSIKINSLDMSDAEQKVLKVLNGKTDSLTVGQTIKITTHSASSSLESLLKGFRTSTRTKLYENGFLEADQQKHSSIGIATAIFLAFIFLVCVAPFVAPLLLFLLIPVIVLADPSSLTALSSGVDELCNNVFDLGATQFLGGQLCVLLSLVTTVALVVLIFTAATKKSKYDRYTEKGLDASKYLDGLYLYIKMAEADRLKFLQSVDGADTSNEGIVKLYEKLLPYAALFGLEKTWMSELSKYYDLEDVESPTWCNSVDAFSTGFMSGALANSISSSLNSVSVSASGGSGYSGGFSSGGGGGGSSGGGSGGGGGGGW